MRIIQEALTFDDVLLEPAYSEVLPREVKLKTQLTRSLSLNIPIISAAMDTVTEARLAIAMAQAGGIGVIHRNLDPEMQAAQVARIRDAAGKGGGEPGLADDVSRCCRAATALAAVQMRARPAGERARLAIAHVPQRRRIRHQA